MTGTPVGLGNWYFDFQIEVQIPSDWGTWQIVTVELPTGEAYAFQKQSNGTLTPYTPSNYPQPQVDYSLSFSGTWPSSYSAMTSAQTTWTLRDPDDNVWTLKTFADPATGKYQVARPVSVVRRNGQQLTFQYGSSYELTSVTDSFGKAITFDWVLQTLQSGSAAQAISQAHLPDGTSVKYFYQAISSSSLTRPDRLSQVQVLDSGANVIDQTTYQYGNTSFPLAITGILDKNSVLRWSVTYDGNGRATSSFGPGNADKFTVAYTPAATTFTRTVTNALGKQSVYNFSDSPPNVNPVLTGTTGVASTNCPASATSLTYGSDKFVATATNENGQVTQYTRNGRGQPTQTVEAYGSTLARTTNTTWDATNHVPTHIVRPGVTEDYGYDGQGRLIALTETDTTSNSTPYSTNGTQRGWTFSWGTGGQLLTINGPLAGSGDTVTYGYDVNGFLASVTNELGQVTTIASVNGRGQPTQIVDSNVVATNLSYDALGRIISVTVDPGANQAVTSLTYDAVGEITQVTLPTGGTLSYTYSDAKRLTAIQDSAGNRIELAYDAAGNVTGKTVKDPSSTVVASATRAYDELSRLLRNIGAASQTTSFAYDKVDNRTGFTDPRSNVYGYTFDALNRLIKETQPTTGHIDATYDGQDRVASVADQRALTTAYVRDGFGDVIRETSPDRGTTDFWYDAAGRLIKRVDARGVETDFAYDWAGRLTAKSFPAHLSEFATYDYDSTAAGNKGVGRLTQITDQSGTTAYTYDSRGNVTLAHRVVGGTSYDTAYAYDVGDNITQVTYPSGRIVAYARDNLGRVTGVTTKANASASAQTVVSGVAWRPFGPLAGLTFGNGLALALTYDQDGQLTDINAGTVQGLHLTYDAGGNITAVSDSISTARNESLTYDVMSRLTNATGAYGNIDYGYDYVGNRTMRRVNGVGGVTQSYTYPGSSNRLSQVSDGSNTRGFSYSAAGNASNDNRPGGPNLTLAYNDNNRLVSASDGSTQLAAYTYDAAEHRVIKQTFGSGAYTHHFIYDQAGHLIAESDASGAVVREYIWLGGLPVALVDAGTLYFIHADWRGAPQKATNSSGTLVWDAQIEPFGAVYAVSGALTQLLKFPGQYHDGETGYEDNWHRTYDPATGRYIQADPLGLAAGVNVYAYVGGNPVTRIDPDGQFFFALPFIPVLAELVEAGALSLEALAGIEAATAANAALAALDTAVAADLISTAMPAGLNGAQKAEYKADYDRYKQICKEPPPPGQCDLDKWKLDRAERCLQARNEFADKWHGGTFDPGHQQQMTQLENQINRLKKQLGIP